MRERDLWHPVSHAAPAKGFDADALPRQLQQHIPELNKTKGSHMVFDQAPERDRAESSCISILALVRDSRWATTSASEVRFDGIHKSGREEQGAQTNCIMRLQRGRTHHAMTVSVRKYHRALFHSTSSLLKHTVVGGALQDSRQRPIRGLACVEAPNGYECHRLLHVDLHLFGCLS